jgi:Carboxypeptidase regulatory-like domain
MKKRNTTVLLFFCAILLGRARAAETTLCGRVIDPQGRAVAGAAVRLSRPRSRGSQAAETDKAGRFTFSAVEGREYIIQAEAPGFQPVKRIVRAAAKAGPVTLQLAKLIGPNQTVAVTANVEETSLTAPDPAERVLVRQELLDANPGRPGAPVSIPGLPIETASGGIKAPQYFAPGVAGDHGEPIAQYIQVGSYRVPDNLSANAHGNGYADPNIMIPEIINGVEVNGGAFNVLEGNHSLNLAAAYELRPRIRPFLTVTGDYRDLDVVAGFTPSDPGARGWLMLEAAYGNGFLDRLEHRQQYKANAFRVLDFSNHELTLFGIGYYGSSYVPGLTPIGVPGLHDTVDPRQHDQTHTAELSANDVWKVAGREELQLSGFFRTYNLSLYSNFGQQDSADLSPLAEQLIRQSEFRTVTGANGTYINHLNDHIALLAGVDYLRDAPRRDDLDRYNQSTNFNVYGPFEPITSNNITIQDAAPYLALNGELIRHLRYYAGWRRDEVEVNNQDLLNPVNSFDHLQGVNNPKATVSYLPERSAWLPTASLSWGEAFFTNDPRIGTGTVMGTAVERSHSYQLVLDKQVSATDFRLTLGHTTTEATLAKIDPDTGLQEDEGPGRLRYLTALLRHGFKFGVVEASFSKADARDLLTGEPTPEAPRTIFDVLGTCDRLPFHLQARSEFEYVGRKPLEDGFIAVPVKEFRGAVLRSVLQQRIDVGMNFLIAGGYTGQTTEVMALPDETTPFERVVGVRLASYVSGSISYHWGDKARP